MPPAAGLPVSGKRLGVTIGWLRLRTGSTLPAALMHALNNLLFLGGGFLLLK